MDKAGRILRDYVQTPQSKYTPEVRAAIVTATNFRDMHEYPMTKVTIGVNHYIAKTFPGSRVRAGQRFKRFRRIVEKLMRQTIRLSQMEDIGGCRAVLPDIAAVYAVAATIEHRWRDAKRIDYIERPKDSGYRGLHLIALRDGCKVEVQLRTPNQHFWAETVENFSPVVGFELKDGEGPDDLRLYFERAAYRYALEDAGETVDDTFRQEFDLLREKVLPFFRRASEGAR